MGFVVTLSCFSRWSHNKKTNGHAKVIPVVPVAASPNKDTGGVQINPTSTRIFFFDDNLEIKGGAADSSGICNLRNVFTGEFVDFSEGKNGFVKEHHGRHTILHHSTLYPVVLVKANILDAMEEESYFVNIISKYMNPGEKALVFMDVNSTIVCVDTITGKSMTEIVLSTMFEFVEIEPTDPCDFVWEGREAVRIDKPISVKHLLKKVAKDDKTFYNTIYGEGKCEEIFSSLAAIANVRWSSRKSGTLDLKAFHRTYEDYLRATDDAVTDVGITKSWFKCYDFLKRNNHSIVMNTFGVDSKKVLSQTLDPDADIMHLTINHKLWLERDQKQFDVEYGLKKSCRRRSTADKEEDMRILVTKDLGMHPTLTRALTKDTFTEY